MQLRTHLKILVNPHICSFSQILGEQLFNSNYCSIEIEILISHSYLPFHVRYNISSSGRFPLPQLCSL